MDGIDAYKGAEFEWAVGTALSSVEYGVCDLFDSSAEEFVAGAMEFICETFADEGMHPPDQETLVDAVKERQKEGALDWVFDNHLCGGEEVLGGKLTDRQWVEISEKISSAKIVPPTRKEIDDYVKKIMPT